MKNYIKLLLILLLPVFGFSQTVDLVKWVGTTDLKPTLLHNYISAENFTGAGISGPYASYDGISGTNWPNGNLDNGKYFQITVNQTLNGSFDLQEINFEYKGNCNAYQVRYARNPGFSNSQVLVTNTNANPYNSNISGNIAVPNISVAGGQTLYIRFYAYNGGGSWKIMNNITLRGKITAAPTPLSGPYIVGGASGAKFNTLTAAVQALNLVGVSGNTTLLLDNDIYNRASNEIFPLVLNSYTGNETYTVTIKPNTGKTVTIDAENENSSTGNTAVFKLNGTDNVIFDGSNTANGTTKDLTVYNNNPINNAKSVFWLANNNTNGANKNTFKNLIVKQYYKEDNYSYGIYSGGTGSLTDEASTGNSSNTVNNVTFTKVGQPVYVNGNATNLSSGWKIQKNSIGGFSVSDKPYLGVFLKNASAYEISGNTIKGVLRNSNGNPSPHSGIIVTGNSSGSIFNNVISDVFQNDPYSECAGIYIASSNNLVYNNIISNIRSNQGSGDGAYNWNTRGFGINMREGANNKIFFNTIVMNSTDGNTQRSAALYLQGGSAVTIKNNIFFNVQNSGTQYGILSQISASQITSNYNDIVAPMTGYFGGDRQSLADWKTATGKDANSLSVAPYFEGSELRLNTTHPNNLLLVGQQDTPIITTDIDGETRNTPTMGADEIAACPLQGDQVSFGNGSWLGYVYSNYTNYNNPAPLPGNANYRGIVTETAIFDRNVGTDVITGGPGSALCAAPFENFFVRYKMRLTNMDAGKYSFKVGGDDGYKLFIDNQAQPTISNWNEHGYTTTTALVTLPAGTHEFVIEYFDIPGSARVSFSYGKVEGDPTVFGDNVWNVYGYNVEDINVQPTSTSYAGYFVDPAVSINSEDKWGKLLSPSSATGWMGAPIGIDNFTVVHKRQGFPCGLYEIRMDKWDDGVELYLDGTRIFDRTAYNGTETNVIVGNYKLNATSKIELRLREGGGDALVKMTLTNKVSVYNNGWNIPDPTNTAVRIDSDFVFTGNLDVCSCTVTAGKKLTISNNAALNVENDVTVLADGKILVKDTGSLVQINPNATFTGSNTSFTMERNSTRMVLYDFTYWSSPVQAQVLRTFSPNTAADKYYSFNGSNWFVENRENPMTPGRGYIIRTPQGWNTNITNGGGNYPGETFEGGVFKGVFTGKANSGNITVPILGNTSTGNDLIGNPYPSPISITKFLAENVGKTDGNFYFWTHKTRVSNVLVNGAYAYNDADYATLNKTGGVATSPIARKPGEYIPAGQGFFVNTTGTGNYVFTNSMRVKGASNNIDFFRNSNNEQTNEEENRYWLSIASATGLYSEFLVGYTEGATNDLDNSFDAVTYSSGNLMLYTILDDKQMAIQGRQAPFNNADVIPVGYKATTAGQYTISINKKEGLFENGQTIYIFDTTTNQYHDLNAGDFIFTTAVGTFENRFEVRYTSETLGITNPVASDSDVIVYKNGNQIAVKAKNFTLENMQVYDITGKLLFNKKGIDNNEFSTSSLNVATQVVVVKVTLDGGQTISKKVIMN